MLRLLNTATESAALNRERRRLMFSRWLFIASGLFLLSAPASQAQGLWRTLAPFPPPPREMVTVAAGGKIYILSGQGEGDVAIGLVYEYDPANNTWTQKKRMPFPAHHTAMIEYNGKIYGFGGFTLPPSGVVGWDPTNYAWEYTPETDSWRALKPLPTKRGAASAAVVNGKIYVMGGAAVHPGSKEVALINSVDGTPHRSVGTVEEYDIGSDSWRERTSMPTPRNHLGIAAINGKIYAFGGRQGSTFFNSASYTDLVEEYDPATDTWGTSRARMPTTREAMSWGVYKNRLYVIGGGSQSTFPPQKSLPTVEAFDPVKNQWYFLTWVLPGREPTSAAIIGDTLYMLSDDRIDRRTGSGRDSQPYPFDALKLDGFFQ
jgi:N-acetylneuraminic acid mutarotase